MRAIWRVFQARVGELDPPADAANPNPLLVRRGLRSPLQTGQIRIFSFGSGAPRGFFRLTENTFGLFFLPLLLELLFAVAFG